MSPRRAFPKSWPRRFSTAWVATGTAGGAPSSRGGVFAALPAPYVKKVVAIEESSAAIKDAAVNTVGIDNLEFIEAKTEDAIGGLEERPDAVILDPSRLGCHPNALDALISNRVPRIVYVSCDPDALARDLDRLVSGGYGVDSVEPLDMFPQTHHVECLATLTFP